MTWLTRLWRRSTPAANTVPDALWQAVEARLPFLSLVPPKDRPRLRTMALAFLETKEFACGGDMPELTDETRLSIALQACLPVLNLGLRAYSGWVGIVVYPGDFVIPRRVMDEDGVVHEYDEAALGEAWEGGPVILGWFDDPADYDGANVVIHEFAHKLDMLNGAPDGTPALHREVSAGAWQEAMASAYTDFCQRVDRGEDTAIDPYASEDPAEFFAVMSEVFFVEPDLLAEEYREVYRQLARYYRQDPLAPG